MAFDNPLAAEIWRGKYSFNPPEGGGDETVHGFSPATGVTGTNE